MKLPKVYDPSQYEDNIYALWEKSQAFKPTGTGKSFSIVVPPPNSNGNLHMGHAYTLAVQDVAVRYHRLKGDRALLLPGADHAGFETQAVYEKHLAKEGKSRFDFSREELYSQIWDFVDANRTNFTSQIRRLGAGVDWDRFAFTLDEKVVNQAYATFKKMWDEGLIYRGERLVNYCTFHRTGFADIEVEHEDTTSPLYYLTYGPFTLATTRPETIFGDTAVAVHPDDKRYAQWVGKTVTIEGPNGPFEVRVVADEMVDPEFGTGAVKITPAHSFDDWDVAKRHNLQAVRIINHDGTLNHLAGRFEGMSVVDARDAVVAALKEKDLLVKVDENYQNRVGKCYKCGTIIEPMLMEQWFLNIKPLAAKAIEVLRADKITFYPESKKQQLIGYMENIWDWNLSRQIAWGIPIPAFQNVDDTDDWIYDENVTEEIIEKDGKTYRRDPDVFDTWFSSSSWPYATLNYPDGDDFKDFYPLSLMETGGEILYPWVSRMLMLGLYVTGEIPFKEVYIHGYVLAEDGAKMSKSLGNVVNPIGVIDEYGSDATRMGILSGRVPAVNRGFDERKVEDARNFCNKLWNVARFIEDKIGEKHVADMTIEPISDADHWMLSKLQQTTDDIDNALNEYKIAEAYEILYHFVWDDFADWYIESSKAQPNLGLLAFALESILKLAHPYAPFVTETIWQTLGWQPDTLLVTSNWPTIPESNTLKTVAFEALKNLVVEVRGITKSVGLQGGTLTYINAKAIEDNAGLLKQLTRLANVTAVSVAPTEGLKLTQTPFDCWLDIDAKTAKRYEDKLDEQLAAAQGSIDRLEQRLGNTSYVAHAPESVVLQTKQQLEEAKRQHLAIVDEKKRFTNGK